MNLNEIRDNNNATKEKKRIGRGIGSGTGKTSGKGHKGQKARSGVSIKGFEGGQMPLFRKLPQRGFNRTRFQKPLSVVNLSDLSKLSGQKVNLESLKNAGLIRPNSKAVKILGTGEVDKSYEVEITLVSKSAREKIEAAGGTFASE